MYKITKDDLTKLIESSLRPEEYQKGEWDSTQNILAALEVKADLGLTQEGIEKSAEYFGTNIKPIKSQMSILEAIQLAFLKPSFLFCSLLSIFALWLRCFTTDWQFELSWIENLVILILILLSVILGAVQLQNNDKKSIQLEQLKEEQKLAKVLRNGREETIQAGDLVVGDIILLNEESEIFVDGLVIEANNLKFDESSITGESNLKQKFIMESEGISKLDTSNHVILGGSKVITGNGKMVVLAVGYDVLFNKLRQLIIIDEYAENGHIHVCLEEIQQKIVMSGTISSILIFSIMIGRAVFIQDSTNLSEISFIVNVFLVLLCGCFSNSLLAHNESSLKDVINQFLLDNLLVRKVKCVAELPYMNKIIFDKTGTLTENNSKLQNIWNDEMRQINDFFQEPFQIDLKTLIIQCCYINNTRYINPQIENEKEIDLYNFFNGLWSEQNAIAITAHFPFNAATKTISTIINQNKILIRGDVRNILNASKFYYSHIKGNIELSAEQKQQIEEQYKEMLKQGKSFAVAYCDIDTTKLNLQEIIDSKMFNLDNLTLLAIIQSSDILRRSAQSVIKAFQQAKVDVLLATGDNFERAIAVASSCNIYDGSQKVFDGQQFNNEIITNCEQFKADLDKTSVLYRASPIIKLELVKQLQMEGNVVGYCGDCDNDAPAIGQADIGFSFGIFGSDKARDSSDIILLDTELRTIYSSIILSKNYLDKIVGFTQFQISFRFCLLFALIISGLVGKNIIYPFQLLWIYIISDLMASIALSYVQPNSYTINRKTLKKNSDLINSVSISHIGILSFYLIIISFIYFNNQIMLFNVFVIILVFNLISARLTNFQVNIFQGIFSSWGFLITLITILILQILITQYGGAIMQTVDGLTLKEWLICFCYGAGAIFWRTMMVFILQHFVDEQ